MEGEMIIDITLSPEQRKVEPQAGEFAEEVLAPIVPLADAGPSSWCAWRVAARQLRSKAAVFLKIR